MGVVRASFDPALERPIAVKLIGGPTPGRLPDTDDEDETKSQMVDPGSSPRPPTSAEVNDAQLLAEARSLARVAHPNIVEVFDVGVCEAGVFIAMELVEGVPLRTWLETHRPDWREAVEVHLPAADALVAAHRVGIVHGDFKPDNVLVGTTAAGERRVKVVDFGLARAISRFEAVPSDQPSRVSAVFGTPAYLAPECWVDERRDSSSDQFAFFVSLFEAIAGRRPFRRHGSLGALLVQMTEGVDPRELDGLAPARLVRAILRGIHPEPAQRFPDMSAAFAELRGVLRDEDGRRAKRRRIGLALAIAVPVVALTAGSTLVSAWRHRAGLAECERASHAIDSEWNADARARVQAGLAAADPRSGTDVAARVEPWLDRYADEWTSLRRTTCERAVEDATKASPVDLARTRCFAERAAALGAMVELFQDADDRVALEAIHSASGLPRLAECDDETWLALHPALAEDPVTRDRIAELQRSLVRADQLAEGGRPDSALVVADEAEAIARELALPAVAAPARATRGHVLAVLGRYDEAARELEAAYFIAGEAADDPTRASAAIDLATVVGTRLARFDDGTAWARHAETAIAAIGGPEGDLHARLALATSAIESRRGDLDAALVPAERALAIRTALYGPDHPTVGAAELTVGTTLARLKRVEDALSHLEHAREIFELEFGPDHPELASIYHNLGMLFVQLERFDEAKELQERCLAIRTARLPADHPDIASALSGLAYADMGLRRFDDAERGFQRVLEIREARFGPDHPAVADALANIAQIAKLRDDCRTSVRVLERALDIVERANAADHDTRIRFGLNLADALLQCGNTERARAKYEAARDLADSNPERFARHRARAVAGLERARVTAG